MTELDEVARLNAAPVQQPKCKTCNDNGRIGGPSFYAPDEGGEPCPDCSAPAQLVSVPDNEDWGVFFGYLIDKCEGHIVAEENLQGWLSEMLADPHYGALFRREKAPAEQPSPIARSIEAAEEEHGSLRAAAKALGIDPGYLYRLKSGEKINPSADVLKALGLERITYYRSMLAAAPAAPAADAGLVEALGYQVLFDAIAAATSVYANGAINISVQAFRDALAAHRAKGVV